MSFQCVFVLSKCINQTWSLSGWCGPSPAAFSTEDRGRAEASLAWKNEWWCHSHWPWISTSCTPLPRSSSGWNETLGEHCFVWRKPEEREWGGSSAQKKTDGGLRPEGSLLVSKCTWSGAGKHDSVWEAQLWGVKFIMVWRMSLHHVPWMESEPVKKSTHTDIKLEDEKVPVIKKYKWSGSSEHYQWRVWLWPGWGSKLGSALQTRLTELSLGRWGSGWTVAALQNFPKLWSTAEPCFRHCRGGGDTLKACAQNLQIYMRVWVHITTDAAGSGWSGEQQPDCAGDWAAGLCNVAGCGASCS